MSQRRIFLDRGVGETRGVVTLDGRPERLILRRDDEDLRLALGARLVARVASVEPAIGTAFLDLGDGLEAILPFKADARPVRGASIEVEIRSEARTGKLAVARETGAGQGAPRLLEAPPEIAEILTAIVRDMTPIEGREARAMADEAEAEVLETVHRLLGGGDIAIEPTRALTSIDVDLGERKGQDAKRVTRQANLAAIAESARLLRLKGLGGLVVLDLVGRGHDGNALLAAARLAFSPDNPGVAIGPVGRFGTMELSIPRRTRPLSEYLQLAGGALSDRALAQRLIRRFETEGAAQPGARLVATCAPGVTKAAEPLVRALAERMGARFAVTADPACPRDRVEVSAS
ncbi:MAG: ribonuclease E/G [Alphaproteobacteria bacterium]|nr:ribonuclease E/G [Alphaproteobacteria bacterium]MBU1516886.1 ribonuclease E/G [Alphaproteobacteria bacterium]MBU2092581.1 ribonuclease E/G [Alphaproteobacteria bacterium]MBU2151308.1 ribonuclease E/G [Alphaproteobacteria bacterium]MBU2309610.1 ribonuclease E/G [Alphaproteobacteria bacterium]